mmetsp:Transcript_48636/g.115783  ORF Transcript_48636/g.115783 Transcript_48636/m.115783 type:complete len:328 (-) Transcript_48636:1859-2842(-)
MRTAKSSGSSSSLGLKSSPLAFCFSLSSFTFCRVSLLFCLRFSRYFSQALCDSFCRLCTPPLFAESSSSNLVAVMLKVASMSPSGCFLRVPKSLSLPELSLPPSPAPPAPPAAAGAPSIGSDVGSDISSKVSRSVRRRRLLNSELARASISVLLSFLLWFLSFLSSISSFSNFSASSLSASLSILESPTRLAMGLRQIQSWRSVSKVSIQGKLEPLHWAVDSKITSWQVRKAHSCHTPGSWNTWPSASACSSRAPRAQVRDTATAVQRPQRRPSCGSSEARTRNVWQLEARAASNIARACSFSWVYCSLITPMKMFSMNTEKNKTPP